MIFCSLTSAVLASSASTWTGFKFPEFGKLVSGLFSLADLLILLCLNRNDAFQRERQFRTLVRTGRVSGLTPGRSGRTFPA